MKTVISLRIDNDSFVIDNLNLMVNLNGCGRCFITVVTDKDFTGHLARLDLGYNEQVFRYLTGYVERSQVIENGSRRLFIREFVGIFEHHFPVSLQHPRLGDVINALAKQTSTKFILPDVPYASVQIPHFVHSGTGYHLLDNLGRAFAIPDYVWFQLPDGTVYAGGYADSRFSNSRVDIPTEFIKSAAAGNSMTLPLIASIRPGVNVNGRRITQIAIQDDDMTLTWATAGKSPDQRMIDKIYPELSAGLHVPRMARVMSPADTASLGDVHDPFRPRYAVNLQLLDENGNPAADTPVYNAVPLPVPMAGAEGGMFQYPPEGAIVEIGFSDGRQDKPIIRQTMPHDMTLPEIKPGEQLQQQRAGVSQRVTVDGSWHRETDQTIRETSAARAVKSDREERATTVRETTVSATDTTTVIGTSTLMAGSVVHLSEGDYATGTSANRVSKVAKNKTEKIGQNHDKEVGGSLTEKIAAIRRSVAAAQEIIAPSIKIGSDSINVLSLLTDTLDVIQTLATQTAQHTHSNTGAPTNAGDMASTANRTTALKAKYSPFIR